MNKLFLFGLIVIILLPSVHAIALSYPNIGDIMFEPEKQVNLEYVIQNGAPKDLPVKVTLGVGVELSDFVTISEHVTKVPGNNSQKIYVTILFPDEMAYGIFPITLTVVEDSPVLGAFIAHVGASHTVKVINAYPTGTPVLEYRGPKTIGASGTSNIDVAVRNIGRTNIDEKKVYLRLMRDNITAAEGYSERVTIPPLEEQVIKVPFKVDLLPGMYVLQTGMTGSKETIEAKVQVGEPTVKIDKIQKFSNENQLVNVEVTNNWLEPLTESTVALLVYASDTSRKVLFEASATSIVLQPGKNALTLRILKSKYIGNGVYPVALQVLSPPFYLGADGELEVELTEIGKMLEQQAQKDPAWVYENVSLDAPRVEVMAKNKKLTILILVVAIAMFLFCLAMIMKRKKKMNQNKKQVKIKMMPKKQSPFKSKLIIALFVLLIAALIFTAIQYSKAKNEGIHFTRQTYPIRAVIEYHRNLGITDNRSLDFPRIPIGTAVTRELLLNNIYGSRIRVVPSAEGNVTPYIISSMEPVFLEIGEMRKFNVTIHGKARPGNYSGNLTLDLYKLI